VELNHVAAIVGGFSSQQKHAGQTGVRFTAFPRDKQARAVAFLNANAFQVPSWMVQPDIVRRIEPVGTLDRVQAAQGRVLGALMTSARIERLVEQESLDGAAAYRAVDFLADVRKGIWNEVYAAAPVKVDAYRRNLQRAYVETLSERINGRQASADDARAFFRGELRTLDRDLQTALARVTDRATRLHVEDVRTQVARALDPAVRETGPAGPARTFDAATGGDAATDPEWCWLDYAIRRR
jgi:hypothetical protein